MVSFDITALFTSIDIPLAGETLATLLKERDPNDTISTDNMLKLLDLCLMTHFTFKGQIYEQINGTHQLINNCLTGIKYTREEEKNEQFPFLDVFVEWRANGEFL
eukprot:g41862.t1